MSYTICVLDSYNQIGLDLFSISRGVRETGSQTLEHERKPLLARNQIAVNINGKNISNKKLLLNICFWNLLLYFS